MLNKIFVLAFLLCAPAWAQFAVGTPEFELRTTDCTTSCPMGNFTVSGNGLLIIQAAIRGSTDSTPANGFTCSVGGVNAPYVTGSSSNTGIATQTRNYEILPANLPAEGSQAVECGTPSGNINSVHLTMFQVTGLVAQTAEAAVGISGTSADTTADSITTVTDGAFVAFNLMYITDPGTVTAGGGQTELLNKSAEFDTRWAHSSYKTGATPARATTGGTTHTSAVTHRSRVAYEVAADVPIFSEAAVTLCRCPGLYDVPQQTLPNGQEGEAYPPTPLAVFGGAEPRVWAIPDGSGDAQ